tara:strand:+ start:1978 stop:2553 length:576 start_codon:yes stop_codon:yes gene_type:complete
MTAIRSALTDLGTFSTDEVRDMSAGCMRVRLERDKRGFRTRFEFRPDQVICFDGVSGVFCGCVKTERKELEDSIVIRKQQMDLLIGTMPQFVKDKEEVLYHHATVNRYMMETITEITDDMKRSGGMELLEENIKMFKFEGNKYYRLTYTSKTEKTCPMSRTEFAFGHLIDGFTYIVEKDLYRANKDRFRTN